MVLNGCFVLPLSRHYYFCRRNGVCYFLGQHILVYFRLDFIMEEITTNPGQTALPEAVWYGLINLAIQERSQRRYHVEAYQKRRFKRYALVCLLFRKRITKVLIRLRRCAG